MIISQSRGFIFLHVLRTGGTSIETALAPHLAWDDLVLGTTELGTAINAPFRRVHGLGDHSTLAEVAAVCGGAFLERCFVFATVRHPLERIVSMYNMIDYLFRRTDGEAVRLRQGLVDGVPDPRWSFLEWRVARGFAESGDFGAFLRSRWTEQSRLFVPQVDQLRCSEREVDLAIRLDRLDEGIVTVERRLGIRLALGRHNGTQVPVLAPGDVVPADRDLIREVFAGDFEAYGFE